MKLMFEGENTPKPKPVPVPEEIPEELQEYDEEVGDEDEEPFVDPDTGISSDDVEQRETDLQEILVSFISDMTGAPECDLFCDAEVDEETLGSILDDIQSVLENYGFPVYRPVIVTDENGKSTFSPTGSRTSKWFDFMGFLLLHKGGAWETPPALMRPWPVTSPDEKRRVERTLLHHTNDLERVKLMYNTRSPTDERSHTQHFVIHIESQPKGFANKE